MDISTEKNLFRQVTEGSEAAFRQLFDWYRLRLYSFVFRLSHSRADAEEVVQDVFLALWEKRSLLSEVEEPAKYIYAMTRNRTLNLLAKAGRDQHLARQLWLNMTASENATEETLEAVESEKLVREALLQLPGQKQRVFHLSRDVGLKQYEIAEKMGISKSRVNNLMVETLRYIRDYLSRHSSLPGLLFWAYGVVLAFSSG